MSWFKNLLEDLKVDEGFRARPYKCTAGKLTIGYGRNLEGVGVSRDEAEDMLANDVQGAIDNARTFYWFEGLSEGRKRAVVNMIFNLGFAGFCKFKNMIAALERGDYDTAAREACRSQWADQVGERAVRISCLIKNG